MELLPILLSGETDHKSDGFVVVPVHLLECWLIETAWLVQRLGSYEYSAVVVTAAAPPGCYIIIANYSSTGTTLVTGGGKEGGTRGTCLPNIMDSGQTEQQFCTIVSLHLCQSVQRGGRGGRRAFNVNVQLKESLLGSTGIKCILDKTVGIWIKLCQLLHLQLQITNSNRTLRNRV